MIEYILLGFLIYGEMTGYDLKQYMGQSTANFYDASFGSIYPALKRLEASGCVSVRDDANGNRARKLYRILPEGRERFLIWMESPMGISKTTVEPLIRVFFLAHMEPAKAKAMLSDFRQAHANEVSHLTAIEPRVAAMADPFQLATLHYGLEHYRHIIRWVDSILETLDRPRKAEERSTCHENHGSER